MATTVLDETDVLLDEENIFGEEEVQPETTSVFEQIALKYRAMGYDAEFVIEDGDDLNWGKYLSADFMKKLEQ